MATSRPATTQCKTCENEFPVTNAMGPIPRFCSAACKPSRAYTAGAKERVAKDSGVIPSSAAKARRGGASERHREGCAEQPPAYRNSPVTVTSETEYLDDETEFIMAMDRYKRDKRRPFPTWSEVLTVLRGLGYRKAAPREKEQA